jgi:branched-chain amino acid transport system ATP-binding protein
MILACHGVHKAFTGVQALVDVSIGVAEGEVLGIIGPNGSGKTTLFNILAGQERADRGRVVLAGRAIGGRRPHRIAALGLARTFQNLRLFPGMTVLENVMAGGHLRARAGVAAQFWPGARERRERAARDEAAALLAEVGLAGHEAALPGEISYGQGKRLELARALNIRPRVLLLDEPTAGMNDAQAADILALILRLKQRWGLTLAIIEHNVPVLGRVADRIAVLDAGRLLTVGTPAEVVRDKQVIAAYLGADAGTG